MFQKEKYHKYWIFMVSMLWFKYPTRSADLFNGFMKK